MAEERFENAEREFLKLKGQFAAGRITREQFETALKELVVEDAQGRFWMLGVDTGKWYVHDGEAWVEATPPGVPPAPSKTVAPTPEPPPPSPKPASQRTGRLLAMIATLGGGLLTILFGLAVTFGQGALRSALLGNSVNSTPTIASALAFTVVPSIALPLPSATATLVPTKTATAIVLVQPSPVLSRSETPVPTITPSKPTETATSTNTLTPTVLSVTPTTVLAPGLYVTSLRLDPPAPRRGQVIVFYPTFLNSANGEQNPRWLVYIYRPDNLKNSLGETTPLGTTIPPGVSEQKSLNWKVSGLNNCENYLARVAWLDTFKKATPFNKPDGSIFEAGFTVCP